MLALCKYIYILMNGEKETGHQLTLPYCKYSVVSYIGLVPALCGNMYLAEIVLFICESFHLAKVS